MNLLFTKDDAWSGGFYELFIKLPDNLEATINSAIYQLWNQPSLEGCFLRSDIEPSKQQKFTDPDFYNHPGHLYGIATLPNNKPCCCGSFWEDYQESGCWATLYLPLGSLGQAYPIGPYPFAAKEDPSPEPWITEVNTWLVNIGRNIYQQLKFEVGVIGFEVDFIDLSKLQTSGIPADRWDGILIPEENGLIWYPPNRFKPYISVE